MISIHHGGQFSLRVKEIQSHLLSFREPDLVSNSILILPTNRWKRRFVENLIESSENRSIVVPRIYSYNEFLEQIYEKFNYLDSGYKSKLFMSSFLKESLFCELLKYLKGSFKYYTILNTEDAVRGIVKRLLRQIDELIQAGYSAETFFKKSIEIKHSRVSDIYTIFKAFEDRILTQYTDLNYIYIDLLKYFTEQHFTKIFPLISKIYFLGFDVYSHNMSRFIEQLGFFVSKLEIHINGNINDQSMMIHTKNDLNYLLNISRKVQFYNFGEKEFFYGREKEQKEVTIDSFPSFEEELRHIFSKIAEFHEKGMPLHEMLIAYPSLDCLRQQVRDIGREFSIPLNLTSGFRLIEANVIQFLKVIFHLCTKNAYYLDIIRFFESPYQNLIDVADIKLLMNAVSKTRKEFGFYQLITILSEETKDTEARRLLCEGIECVEKLLLNHFNNLNSAQECVTALYSLLKEVDFFTQLVGKSQNYLDLDISLYEPNVRAFYRFSELLESVAKSYDHSNYKRFNLRIFKDILFQEIQDTDFQLQEIKQTSVSVMPLLELRSERPKLLFIAGMNQSVFPKIARVSSLFSAQDREILHLSENNYPLEEDRYLLYLALNRSEAEIFISDHCQASETDRQSNLIMDLKALVKQKKWSKEIVLNSKLELKNDAREKEFPRRDYDFFATRKMKEMIRNQFQNHSFSASQLQRYVDCPYQYLLQDILKLKNLEELAEDLSPLEFGSMMHQIMYRVYAENPSFTNLQISEKYKIIQEIVENELGELNKKDPLYLDKFEVRLQIDRFKKIIDEDAVKYAEFNPKYFEWRFGNQVTATIEDANSTDEFLQIAHSGGHLKISGKIDRIDLNEKNEAILIDYKNSASTISAGKISTFKLLQIPIYILAVNDLIEKTDAVAGLIFVLGKAKTISKKIVFENKDAGLKGTQTFIKDSSGKIISFETFLDMFKEKLVDIHQAILEASFPLMPVEKNTDFNTCKNCNFKVLCRVKEKFELKKFE